MVNVLLIDELLTEKLIWGTAFIILHISRKFDSDRDFQVRCAFLKEKKDHGVCLLFKVKRAHVIILVIYHPTEGAFEGYHSKATEICQLLISLKSIGQRNE